MNDEQLDDLKQFIDSRISQAEAQFEERVSASATKLEHQIADIRNDVPILRDEMHAGFAGVGEAIVQLHKADAEFDERLSKLEQQPTA